MNYGQVYDEGKRALVEANIAESEINARLLLEYVCKTDRNTLLAHSDKAVSQEELVAYRECIQRRSKHHPLEYITGTQEFMGFTFQVNGAVLIPRQDTEILVEEVLFHLHDGMEILDMCTGSGCILLSLLKYSNDCKGMGADLSQEALCVAKENAKQLEVEATFVQSDLFDQIKGKFDIIVSNPPYIETAVIPTLMEEVKDYEPLMALDGKEDGLFFYRKIIAEAKNYLNGGGTLFLEIGYSQADAVRKSMESEGYKEITVKKDYAGLDRVVYGKL